MSETKVEMLPSMPKKHPTLSLTVEAVLDHDFERYSDGSMRMTYERCEVSKNGKVIGNVSVAMPVGVVITVGQRSYYIGPQELWNAVEKAEQEQSQ